MRVGRSIRLASAFALIGLCGPAPAQSPGPPALQVEKTYPGESSYVMKPFGKVAVYRPQGNPVGVALFLSGDGGWQPDVTGMSRALADHGILVAGVSTPALLRTMEAAKGKCINANYPLVDLARDIQHRMGVKSYMKPIIFGYSEGATLAYGSLAQWPNGGYRGVVSMGFSADIPGAKPYCAAPGFAAKRIAKPEKGWLFAPSSKVKVPWIVLQGQDDTVVNPAEARAFANKVPSTTFVDLPKVGHGYQVQANWVPQLMTAIAPMLQPTYALPSGPHPPVALPPDLPLTIVQPKGGKPSDTMAVIYSGDGGWVGIDRDVAGEIARAGIPVVGMDSLSYFWSARTPRGAGADLGKIVNAFSQRWHRPKVVLIGYSFGADVMPYMVANMDPAARAKVAAVNLLGLSPSADFQFRLGSWLDIPSAQAMPTIPAVTRLRGLPIRCVRGMDEDDSACPAIPRGIASIFTVPGGHHFNRNAPLLARIILSGRTTA
ncbi:MAG: AcvB/VirJ family lysyl-phosphatidylglycerol hydrolase [Sphingobium phenoxybenzoativorans]